MWKPWERSTGPKTPEGKAKVSQNAFKGGERQLLRALSKELSELQRCVWRIPDLDTEAIVSNSDKEV